MESNCREIVDTAQVGARSTPAMAALAMVNAMSSETTSKKRKVNSTSSQLKFSSSSPSCTSSREAPASCCSSNGSSELVKEEDESMDLEEEAGSEVETSTTCYCRRERSRETTPSSEVGEESEVVESTARPMSTEEVESGRELTPEKIPSESELEDFFAVNEKKIQKRFAEKYNYDIGKDKPLEEGRYEWVRLKP